MKKLVVAMLVFIMPQGLWAGSDLTDWHEIGQLRPGEGIRLVDANHKKHFGAFSSFSNESVVLRAETGTEMIARENILEISRSKRSHRVRNVVVSGLVGAGVGAAITGGASRCQNFCVGPGRGLVVGIGAALGLLGGVAVGSFIPSHQTIYRAPR